MGWGFPPAKGGQGACLREEEQERRHRGWVRKLNHQEEPARSLGGYVLAFSPHSDPQRTVLDTQGPGQEAVQSPVHPGRLYLARGKKGEKEGVYVRAGVCAPVCGVYMHICYMHVCVCCVLGVGRKHLHPKAMGGQKAAL